MQLVWSFKQEEYIHKNSIESDGLCFALSCRWAKLMLKCPKSWLSAPTIEPKERDLYFGKPGLPQKLHDNQVVNDTACEAEIRKLGTLNTVYRIVRQNMPGESFLNFARAIQQEIAEVEHNKLEQSLIPDKLRAAKQDSCASFSTYFDGCQPGCCYIYVFNSGGGSTHAMASYVTSGVLNYDYYLFDPNIGELKASGWDDAQKLLDIFAKEYKVRGDGPRTQVVYSR